MKLAAKVLTQPKRTWERVELCPSAVALVLHLRQARVDLTAHDAPLSIRSVLPPYATVRLRELTVILEFSTQLVIARPHWG